MDIADKGMVVHIPVLGGFGVLGTDTGMRVRNVNVNLRPCLDEYCVFSCLFKLTACTAIQEPLIRRPTATIQLNDRIDILSHSTATYNQRLRRDAHHFDHAPSAKNS